MVLKKSYVCCIKINIAPLQENKKIKNELKRNLLIKQHRIVNEYIRFHLHMYLWFYFQY